MINHVVLFKLKEFPTEEEKLAILCQFKDKLLALRSVITELKYMEVGTHYLLKSSSFDLCLISHFETVEDLEKYKVHPEHVKLLDFITSVTTDRAAIDFEF